MWITCGHSAPASGDEHRVVESATGKAVMTFLEQPDFTRPWDPSHEGAASVVINEDGASVTVTYHDDEVRVVPIPGKA